MAETLFYWVWVHLQRDVWALFSTWVCLAVTQQAMWSLTSPENEALKRKRPSRYRLLKHKNTYTLSYISVSILTLSATETCSIQRLSWSALTHLVATRFSLFNYNPSTAHFWIMKQLADVDQLETWPIVSLAVKSTFAKVAPCVYLQTLYHSRSFTFVAVLGA